MIIFSSGPPARNIQDLLVRSFKHHTRGKKGTRPIREQARSLATEIMGAIRWAQSFVPPSKASVDLLSNLLEGYIVAVNETAGWALEVDDRWENQAKVVATREFKQGEIIPHLEGIRAPLTEQEEKILEKTGRDFSVGGTGRGPQELMLGGARFVNHACRGNYEQNHLFIRKMI